MSKQSITAVIFDMDGLLINSEIFWRRAMIRIFGEVGLTLTEEMCATTMGYRIDEVVQLWFSRHPWEGPDVAKVTERIVLEVRRLVIEEGEPLPGVEHIFDFLEARNITLALASSSHMILIDAVVDKLKLRERLVYLRSAELEAYGKPHPQVFISTADHLEHQAERCLVFEDSLNGVIAGKAARMKVVAIPEESDRNNKAFNVADLQLNSLLEFNEELWQQLQS